MDLAVKGYTRDPLLGSILQAKMINQALGGAFVDPGEVQELPVEFVEAVRALAHDLGSYQHGLVREDELFAKWRAKSKTYKVN